MGFDFGNFAQATANAGINGLFGWLGAKRQNKWNRENMAYQSDLQKGLMDYSNQIWQEQNETQVGNQMQLTRQNPILNMEGMQQAGMNPNAQFSGNVASAPSGTNAASGSVGIGQASNPFSTAFDLFGKMNELNIQQAQKELLDTQAANVKADTEGKEIDNKWKDSIHGNNVELTKQQIETNRQQRQTLLSEMYKNDSQRAQIDKETEWMDTLNAEQQNVLQKTAEKYMAEALLDLERINTEKSAQALNVHLGKQADAAAEKYHAEAEESRQRAATESVARQIKVMERDLIAEGVSPNDASAFSTTLRRAIFHPDYYGGKEKAVEFINATIAKQFQSDINKSAGSGPFGILDIWKYLEGHTGGTTGRSQDYQNGSATGYSGSAGSYTFGATHGH